MPNRTYRITLFTLAAAAMLSAQPRPAAPAPPVPPPPPPAERGGPHLGPPGKWWDNPEMARRLNLTADQQKKMDDIFQQSRVRLIDLHAALDKDEAILEPLMQAPQPDDSKVLPQIDKIAQARAELEKANARLLLAIRHVLTPEQWQILQTRDDKHPRPRGGHPGGPDGPPPADRPRR